MLFRSRSLGVWDFNRDGKLDQYVTHLDHPFSILRNDGEKLGNWIALELIGVRSERDAIGATVRVQAGGGQWVHQRLAGNGFECSNEGVVHIGLGNHEVIDVLEIQWPTGEKSRWEKVPTRRRLQVIEGHPELIEIGLVNGER